GFLPLGTGMTLNYTSPLFMAAIVSIAMWHRGERQASQGWLYATIVSSFAGVVLILQPGGGGHQAVMPTLIGLFSGLLSAFAYFQLRSLSRYGEPEWRIVFWFSVVNCVMSAAAATVFDGWHPVAAADLGGLLAVGVLALVGQLCLTRAFSYGRTLLSANLQYSGVVFAALIGWLVFDERLDGVELAGIVLVVVSSAAATVTSVRRDPVRVAAGPGDGTAPGAAVPGGAVPASSTAPASEIAR
ncbi:MAG: DMT family transporter, partial [Burkholderiaceae bacterium]